MFWFFLKVLLLVVIAILIRGSLPRYRIDQIMTQNWKVFIYWYIASFFVFIIVLYFFA